MTSGSGRAEDCGVEPNEVTGMDAGASEAQYQLESLGGMVQERCIKAQPTIGDDRVSAHQGERCTIKRW